MTSEEYYQKAFMLTGEQDTPFFKGICYTFGYGVIIDLQKAKNAYTEGAKQKNVKCMYGLAALLLKSKVVSDTDTAHKLFCAAFQELYRQAQLGDPISQRMVSCYYLFGDRGVSQDFLQAKNWLMQAAESGDMDAQMNLAHCYETGNVFCKNLNLALEWYAKSAIQGNQKALKKIDELRRDLNE